MQPLERLGQGRSKEFDASGGRVREADYKNVEEITAVRDLYIQPHVIEHLASVSPDCTVEELQRYYENHPDARLLVAELPHKGIVGVMTITPEEGLRSAKFNRLAVDKDERGKGVATKLIREALSQAFSSKKSGGLRCEQVFAAQILSVDGYDIAQEAFKSQGFNKLWPIYYKRCDSWSNEKGRMVPRNTQQMVIQRGEYITRSRYRRDLETVPQASALSTQVFPGRPAAALG